MGVTEACDLELYMSCFLHFIYIPIPKLLQAEPSSSGLKYHKIQCRRITPYTISKHIYLVNSKIPTASRGRLQRIKTVTSMQPIFARRKSFICLENIPVVILVSGQFLNVNTIP